MSEHILFLTGKLAERSLRQVLEEMQPTDFTYEVYELGIRVAALMTAEMIGRRLKSTFDAHRIMVPGRCRGNLDDLSGQFGLPVERGPEELKDLAVFFGGQQEPPDLSRYEVEIFAEIVDAPELSVEAIVKRALEYHGDGADVIDLGCLPDTPFPHLSDSVRALKELGFKVSVDSLTPDDLITGGQAGADFILSLNEQTLWVADEVESTPVLIPRDPSDPDSLYRVLDKLECANRRYIADSILDPIHFGFADSLVRYHQLRTRAPNAEIMMGIGNLTELTEADTVGINAMLMGLVSEMRINHVLVTQVSPHCRTVIREVDRSRRIMYRARNDNGLPKQVDDGLTALHERKPFPYAGPEIRELAAAIRDPSFRIQVSEEGIHIYNRDGLAVAENPFDLFPSLNVDSDGGHAFYLGVELARAQIAWQLGKRYVQDEELRWGCIVT
ncbi:MAG: DUF6513 domain-containing protein, partial [Gammaproteobacteria bacterium]|nr:DUF6513 domain-containing protein [Gammaproteobacteria bacterium]